MGDVMILTNQIMKQPDQTPVGFIASLGQSYEIDASRDQSPRVSADWCSNCLADAVAYDGPGPFHYE